MSRLALRPAFFIAMTLALAACTAEIRPPGVEVKAKPVEVEVEPRPHRPGRFCPPGHAKKGWC